MSDWLVRLEAIADAATPGPWVFGEMPENETTVLLNQSIMDTYEEVGGQVVEYHRIVVDTVNMTDEDANFIEAFNPATVKAMCAVIRAAGTLRKALNEEHAYPWPALDIAFDDLRNLVVGPRCGFRGHGLIGIVGDDEDVVYPCILPAGHTGMHDLDGQRPMPEETT